MAKASAKSRIAAGAKALLGLPVMNKDQAQRPQVSTDDLVIPAEAVFAKKYTREEIQQQAQKEETGTSTKKRRNRKSHRPEDLSFRGRRGAKAILKRLSDEVEGRGYGDGFDVCLRMIAEAKGWQEMLEND